VSTLFVEILFYFLLIIVRKL